MPEKGLLSRRGLVACLAIVALTVSLANRVVRGSFDDRPTAHSASYGGKIQHRDKDALEWFPPVPSFAVLSVTGFFVAGAATEKAIVCPPYVSLYNRPPPIS